jgi:hypothetical protein
MLFRYENEPIRTQSKDVKKIVASCFSSYLATVRNANPLPEALRKRHGSVTARSRLVTGDVTGKAQKFSHFPQVVTVSRVKRGMGGCT